LCHPCILITGSVTLGRIKHSRQKEKEYLNILDGTERIKLPQKCIKPYNLAEEKQNCLATKHSALFRYNGLEFHTTAEKSAIDPFNGLVKLPK
jgi:hypothetical protein